MDQGLLSLGSKVADFWPAFGSHGKSAITIRQVLLHQAGLPRRGFFNQILHLEDWDRIIHNLANQTPEYPPGEKTAYHTLNFGYILGEVIRRVSGIHVDEFLRSELTLPLGLDNTSMTVSDSNQNTCTRLSSGTIDQHPVAILYNSSKLRQSVIPGGSLHTTARDLAIFYQMLLNEGRYAGKNYLRSETVRLATSLGFEGFDASYGRLTRWGFGFNLGGEHELNPEIPDGMGAGSSIETFGHFGQRTSMAWADKRERLVVVFLCNRFLSHLGYKHRLRSISDAAWEFCQDG
jgi:CubicO group peptidase (beta-lactamase class C family)